MSVEHKALFLNFSMSCFFFFFCQSMDWLQPKPPRGDRPCFALMLVQSPLCRTKEAAWWRDERTALICLRRCLSLSLIKGSGPDDARGGGSGSVRSEQRNISGAELFRRRCPSVWCQLSLGQQHETQPLIYHIQDLSVPLISRDILQHRDKGRTFTEGAVILQN